MKTLIQHCRRCLALLALAAPCAVPAQALADEAAEVDPPLADLRARIDDAERRIDRGEVAPALEILEPLEQAATLHGTPYLADVRFLLVEAHVRGGTPLSAIAALSRVLQMPDISKRSRRKARQRFDDLVQKQIARATPLAKGKADELAQAIAIFDGLERAGGAVMAQPLLAQVRYGLHRAYMADDRPLLAAVAGLRFVDMPEAPRNVRQRVRRELDDLLTVENAARLLGNITPEEAIATLEALQGESALDDEPRYFAAMRAALARAHVERGDPREAARVLRRTIEKLPGEMDAERAHFRTEASALDNTFGKIQISCPPDDSRGIQVTIHGPVDKPGVEAETLQHRCSTALHPVIEGLYVITAYSADPGSDFGTHRLEVAIEAGPATRKTLRYVPPVEPVEFYPLLATLSGATLVTALILTVANDAPEAERVYTGQLPIEVPSSSIAAYRKADAEGFTTERAVIASLYATSAVLAIVAAFDYGRVRSEAADAPAASTSPAFAIQPGGIGLHW